MAIWCWLMWLPFILVLSSGGWRIRDLLGHLPMGCSTQAEALAVILQSWKGWEGKAEMGKFRVRVRPRWAQL